MIKLRKSWDNNTATNLIIVGMATLAKMPPVGFADDFYPYRDKEFAKYNQMIESHRAGFQEIVHISKIYQRCAEAKKPELKHPMQVFRNRLEVLMDCVAGNTRVIEAAHEIQRDILYYDAISKVEAAKAIARARGGPPSVS